MFENIRIILVETSHPGNIGAAARAMKNMALSRLSLVRPVRFPCAEATARASGADDVLASARICDSLEQAVGECRLIIGTSARQRSISWPVLTPRECAEKIMRSREEAALVFGREDSGLLNRELDLCHYLVQIPTNPQFSSLNLGAAVQVLSYELYTLCGQSILPQQTDEYGEQAVSGEDMERFYAHLEETLTTLNFFDPEKPKRLRRRLRRLFNRAAPNRSELNILRGILRAAQNAAKKQE